MASDAAAYSSRDALAAHLSRTASFGAEPRDAAQTRNADTFDCCCAPYPDGTDIANVSGHEPTKNAPVTSESIHEPAGVSP